MEPITVLSDGSRGIDYDNMIELLNEWITDEQRESVVKKEKHTESKEEAEWGKAHCCIVDYQDAAQAVSAANAIRAFMPQIPLLVITDFQSLIRKRHLQLITGTGLIKMILWQEEEPERLIMEIQRWLHSFAYRTKTAQPSTQSIRR
ncbi:MULTISPECIES: hypothetical protein [Paenibacillus]|uniref:Uncharacterized protein n=1 Tax=Paenibacillus pabuli TaxID=1472 RepID=A0A855XQC1_9BACL|nr:MULTISPECIES: hypothetical protein [Paenibacillus]PWW35164.1 hypothetical protein DET56_113168 [Paenibacillus pabuli]PXW01922.1 hypothetical protein DEU73_112167 [Paenibacillus taichungensis]RAI91853.1 hypothetical protein DET54_111172 [Paenibacillus pabuli]